MILKIKINPRFVKEENNLGAGSPCPIRPF